MRIEPIDLTVRNGLKIQLRNAEEADAAEMIRCLHVTCGETPFLLREPEETDAFTVEGEEAFLRCFAEDPKRLMLMACIDGKHVGNCSFEPAVNVLRAAHRCTMGIALYREYCGLGIGEALLRTAMEKARECGYEIMELDVAAKNERAQHLYRKLGFEIYGVRPNALKYADGSYDAEYAMRIVL